MRSDLFARAMQNLISIIPYLELLYCHSSGFRDATGDVLARSLMFLGGFIWWLFLVRLVAKTAQKFVRTLVTITSELGMPARLAGVTLLPLGNGAPNMFSALAAVRNDQASLALGSAIGSSLFVTTFVVGAVVFGSGGSIDAKGMLLRDSLFLLIGSICVFAVLLNDSIHWVELFLLIVFFVVYVIVVAFGHNVPPLIRAERAAWYSARAVVGKPRRTRQREQERQRMALDAEADSERRQAEEAVGVANSHAKNLAPGLQEASVMQSQSTPPVKHAGMALDLRDSQDDAPMSPADRAWETPRDPSGAVRSPRHTDDTEASLAEWRRRRQVRESTAVSLSQSVQR